MSEELAKENSNVQTKLSYLSVIGVCTPMIGLLGTVTGMMSAFSTLGTSGIGDPSSLAGAIGEVLIATASGLFIAIPAFAFFYYLRNRAAGAMHVIEDTVNSLFRKMPYDLLHGVHIGDEELFCRRAELGSPPSRRARRVCTIRRTSMRPASRRRRFPRRPRQLNQGETDDPWLEEAEVKASRNFRSRPWWTCC